MISFVLNNITAMGSAQVLENGDTKQNCLLETKIEGIVTQNKIINDVVEFTVPNSVMAGSTTPTVAGWEYIVNTLAPEWVAINYAQLP
jgi:hypothetical protein